MKLETYSLVKLQRGYFKAQLSRLHKDHEGVTCHQCWTPLQDTYCHECDHEVNTKHDSFLNLTAEEYVLA